MPDEKAQKSSVLNLVEKTIEFFHLGYAAAPAASIILTGLFAAVLNKNWHLEIELALIASVLVINFLLLLRPKTAETKDKKGARLFFTFWTNRIKPAKLGIEQDYSVKIAVVEVARKEPFHEKLTNEFGDSDTKLQFFSIKIGHSKVKDELELIEDFKRENQKTINDATAIVVARTKGLEKDKPWVYKTIDRWAYENSEVPILFAKSSGPFTNEIAKNFIQIPEDTKSLPWRLLQRAGERGRAWFDQAVYNRTMAWNLLYLLIMFLIIGSISIERLHHESQKQAGQKQDELRQQVIAESGLYDALETKRKFERDIFGKKNDDIHVSYWFRHNGMPKIFVTTEKEDTKNEFHPDPQSLIGCGFTNPNFANKVIACNGKCGDSMKAIAADFWGENSSEVDCTFAQRPDKPISYIACATLIPGGKDSSETVFGICVFTGGTEPILGKGYHSFLHTKLSEYSNKFGADYKSLTPKSERLVLAVR
jgi:hypothetical protein